MDYAQLDTAAPLIPEIAETKQKHIFIKIPKDAIRTSLKASSTDGIFAAIFSITTTGILLSNFLVELGASPVAFGMLSSIPMLANLFQPLGAYLSERTNSRFHYSIWTFGISRLLWIILFFGICMTGWGLIDSQQLVILTLFMVLMTHLLGGLGSASWLAWLAVIVPRRLRGRYFGMRNSLASLTNLICIPIGGFAVSHWAGGTIQGYGVILLVGILSGLVSLGCQYFKVDVDPKKQNASVNLITQANDIPTSNNVLKNPNFLMFLVYFGFWTFAINLSTPFFSLYLLDNLQLDVSWVSVYGSLQAGANLLMLIFWGRLADRIGNRPLLIGVGVLVALIPLLWLGIGVSSLDLWLLLPLLHIFIGGSWAAIDLCSNNLQLGIAPLTNQSSYFAIASAVAGASGALGTTIGGFIAENSHYGGLPTLFAVSVIFRVTSIIPLVFVQERQAALDFKFGMFDSFIQNLKSKIPN